MQIMHSISQVYKGFNWCCGGRFKEHNDAACSPNHAQQATKQMTRYMKIEEHLLSNFMNEPRESGNAEVDGSNSQKIQILQNVQTLQTN